MLGAWLCKPAFTAIRNETNYEEAGGAPLLGVNGTIIISHGISSARAIRNAIRVSGDIVTTRVNQLIVESLAVAVPNQGQTPASKTPLEGKFS